MNNFREQRSLIEGAIAAAPAEVHRHALDGTIGDTQALCWTAQRQYDRRQAPEQFSTREDFGLHYADLHILLLIAHEAVSHVELLERLLERVGDPQELPPGPEVRAQLREARNLLAEHRDERVLYWRLTGHHTPHVIRTYERLCVPMPDGSIDSEVIAYAPPPEAGDEEIVAGQASVGMLGGLLSLPELHASLGALEAELRALGDKYRGSSRPPARLR